MIALFTGLIVLQFLVVASHDLIDVSDWVRGSQVQAVMGRRKIWLATLVNSIFPGIAAGFALYFWNHPKPLYVPTYWVVYCAISVASAVGMWYVPYLRGAPEKQKREYSSMYAGTRYILPPRGDNPRPNVFHMGIHVLFLATLFLAIVLRVRA